ncbi:group II intron reverse transcriptase/maturase [Endozoicomonas numazuensis]|uniref:group II intron reverse transcriptase/maturase n=1 Tax=Endozoicomonas numazuensis TaxID=1137799 RepID=UPI000B332BAF|nr:group II intron reverse transcriptase/maturase [Endozoicomonas numazuensis]
MPSGHGGTGGCDVMRAEVVSASQDYESPASDASLMARIAHPNNLKKAFQRVKRNKGAAGIDRMTVEDLFTYLQGHGRQLRQCLSRGLWKPTPVRRVLIPKPDGGERKLGIPTALDRMVQQAIQQVLQAEWEPRFSAYSYGFRPYRSAHQAISQAQLYMKDGYNWVVDIDLSKFFDRVNHDRLMAKLAEHIEDKDVLRLIRRFLKSGVMENGLVKPQAEGVPQGGPLSPVLSNIVLDELDRTLENRGLRFVRYADDCRVFVKSKKAGERVMASLVKLIEGKMKLKVNHTKSAVDRAWKRPFLGYSFTRDGRKTLATKSGKRFKDKIRQLTRKGGRSLEQRLEGLNRYLQGWKNYFREVETHTEFEHFDCWIRRRLRSLLWYQWKRSPKRYKELRKQGISDKLTRQTVASGKGHWRVSRSPALHMALPNSWFDKLGLIRLLAA